jgi:hypothetical protein
MPAPETAEANGMGDEARGTAAEGSALAEEALRPNKSRREAKPARALPAKVLRKARRSCRVLDMRCSLNTLNVSDQERLVKEG